MPTLEKKKRTDRRITLLSSLLALLCLAHGQTRLIHCWSRGLVDSLVWAHGIVDTQLGSLAFDPSLILMHLGLELSAVLLAFASYDFCIVSCILT